MNNIGEKYAIIDNFDKTVMFFDKSVRLYNGIKIYNEDEKIGGGEHENVLFIDVKQNQGPI